MIRKLPNGQKGQSLVEIIVALGVFVIVVTIGLGAVLTLFSSNKKSQELKSVLDNLNAAMETMTRELSVASMTVRLFPQPPVPSYICGNVVSSWPGPQDCLSSGGTEVTFCSSDGEAIAYRFNNNSIERRVESESEVPGECSEGESITWPAAPGDWLRVTAPEVRISNISKFYVSGAGFAGSPYCKFQPLVLIKIDGESGPVGKATKFELQTTVSQRAPNLSITYPSSCTP
ncbi:MAG: hypothetical protein G01um1014107_62 [Parcubacteria group bacterium Gr01-1014_107]|nr:MAG: hypothetical protein G01um1014107_62 [Parcubacteria group bacterium Gr01-1014_107]